MMRDQELVRRLPIPGMAPARKIVSKYFRNLKSEDYERSYLDELIKGGDDRDPAIVGLSLSRHDASKSGSSSPEGSACEAGLTPLMPKDIKAKGIPSDGLLQTNYASYIHADGLPTPPQSAELEDERRKQEQEMTLATLGVTGAPKPVLPRRRFPSTSQKSARQYDASVIVSVCASNLSADL